MAIIWAGGEDIDFPGSALTINTSAGFDTGMSRCTIASTTNGAIFKSTTFNGGAVSSAWVSFQCYFGTPTTEYIIGGISLSTAGNEGILIGINTSTSSKVSLYKVDGTNTILASETGTSLSGFTRYKFDIHISTFGASATVDVYINTALIISYTGDITTTNISTEFDCVGIIAYTARLALSEIIVSDEDTRLMRLKTLAPNAAGDANDWTGAYTNVDETTNSDTDVIYTDTTGQALQLNLTGMPAGTYNVKAVKMAARVSDGYGALDLKIGVKTNSAIHLGSQNALGNYWKTIEYLVQNNPETSAAFTGGEIDALQVAFNSETGFYTTLFPTTLATTLAPTTI